MKVPDALKINKFKLVRIPKNSDFALRYGFVASPSSLYSGEDVVPDNLTKTQSLAEAERIAELLNKEDSQK